MSAERIRILNDTFRRSLTGGRILLTDGVGQLSPDSQALLLRRVATFDAFGSDNDPYGEHDFGALEHEGERYFFKIDYYDQSMSSGSDDPADPCKTKRVMTIMRADEY